MGAPITQHQVDTNLEHAVENGYFVSTDDWTVAEIVTDLQCYSSDFDSTNTTAEELTPFVQNWYDRRKAIVTSKE